MGFLLVQIIGGLIADSCDEDHTIFVRGHVGAKGCGSSVLIHHDYRGQVAIVFAWLTGQNGFAPWQKIR